MTELYPIVRPDVIAPPRSAARLRHAHAPEAFAPFVEALFVLGDDRPELLLPNGGACLLITSGESGEPVRLVAAGTFRNAYSPAEVRSEGVGIRFRPGGLSALAGIDARQLDGRVGDLAALLSTHWAASGAAAGGAAADPFRTGARVLDLLSASRRRGPAARADILRAASRRDLRSVEELAKSANASLRQMERHFQQFVGISPKALIRINRFRRAMRLRITRNLSWSAAALQSGYYDQSHLANECRTMTGVAPTKLATMLAEGRAFRI